MLKAIDVTDDVTWNYQSINIKLFQRTEDEENARIIFGKFSESLFINSYFLPKQDSIKKTSLIEFQIKFNKVRICNRTGILLCAEDDPIDKISFYLIQEKFAFSLFFSKSNETWNFGISLKRKRNNDFFNFIFLQLKFASFFCWFIFCSTFLSSFFPDFFLLSALASEFPSLWELNVYVGVAGMCDGILCCLPLSCFSHLFSNLDLKGEWVRTNFCVLCIHVT